MKELAASYRKLDKDCINALKAERPKLNHVCNIINEETCVYLDDKLIAIYQKANFNTDELLKTCHNLKFEPYARTSGMVTKTININAVPRNPRRDNVCKMAKLSYSAPAKHKVFLNYAKQIAQVYRKYFSLAYAGQVKGSFIGKRRVNINYLIRATPFTGAVANKDSALNYHYDGANTKDGISCMIMLTGNISGGELIIPELNIGFACQDDFILLFDGQRYLHGVTEIIKATGGYRYTVVYYNNKGMRLCLPPEEEMVNHQQWLETKITTPNEN